MVSHHPARFGGHRYYGSGDMMFAVVEEQDSRLDPPLLFISKVYGMPCSHTQNFRT